MLPELIELRLKAMTEVSKIYLETPGLLIIFGPE